MALQLAYADQSGNNWGTAYYTVTGLNINYRLQFAAIEICVFRDAAAYTGGMKPVTILTENLGPAATTQQQIKTNPDGTTTTTTVTLRPAFNDIFPLSKVSAPTNQVAAVYAYLKTLPEYKNAVDV